MIIGYDFWNDGIYYGDNPEEIMIEDNDGIAFDTCNPIQNSDVFTLKGGTFEELHIVKDSEQMDNNTTKTEWNVNTVLLAKFENNLIAGTMGIGDYDISQIRVMKKKKDDAIWKVFFTIDYSDTVDLYTIMDKLIESEENYEYCLQPIAVDENGNEIMGGMTLPQEIYISYDKSHIFDNTETFDLIYNLQIGSITNQIGANTVNTLSSPYPYVIYGQNNYLTGSIECLLATEESAFGQVDIKSEKILRNKIISFLSNKNHKILKTPDGLYMLIQIIGNPVITPLEGVLGIYQVSFEYVEVGDVNDVQKLSNINLEFSYLATTDENTEEITKTVG
jgi:flagellar basal body-associated protein FliL